MVILKALVKYLSNKISTSFKWIDGTDIMFYNQQTSSFITGLVLSKLRHFGHR